MKKKNPYPHLRVVKPQQPIYPNAAEPSYYSRKALDIVTAILSGMGFVSAMIFLFTLS